ncbi:MAG: murein biosynthesis integral membrane protein MurJ [Phycisphaerales bacterium]|nr:murein biosynthesis integral membrane protein MurJ [Phycisphaerales bacterium]
MSKSFETHARTLSVLTFLSRVTGLARDAALSRVFGVGAVTDAFTFGFMVPNLFRRLFGEGALSSSFLPVYARLQQSDPASARALARLVLCRLVVLLGAICLVGEVILWMVWPAADQPSATLAARLVCIMLPYMPLVCFVAMTGAVLQVHHRFGPPAAAPIILNLFIVLTSAGLAPSVVRWIGMETLDGESHITIVAASVVVAGIVQCAWSAWALRGLDLRTGEVSPVARQSFKAVIQQVIPMALGLGVLQVNTFVDALIASYPTLVGPTILGIAYPLAEGSMGSLAFAQRLYEFPLGVFGISIATAIFPQLSREATDLPAFRASIARALRMVAFIGLPASVGLIMLRTPLTAAVFQGGDFTTDDTARVATILLAFAPAIWAYSANHLLTRAFYARGESMTPVKISLAMVVLNFLLNVTLIWTPLGTAGLALSTSFCAVVQMVWMLRVLTQRVGPLVDEEVRRSWMRSAAMSVTMAVVLALAMLVTPVDTSWWTMVWVLLTLTAVGAAVVFAVARLLRMPELGWSLGRGATSAA